MLLKLTPKLPRCHSQYTAACTIVSIKATDISRYATGDDQKI